MPNDAEATYSDEQVREAIAHGKERNAGSRRYGMVCAEIMEQQQNEIERLKEVVRRAHRQYHNGMGPCICGDCEGKG